MDGLKPFTLLFVDIDNFKNINDRFGHSVGDQVLKNCGDRLLKLQSDDVQVARFGGDEFTVIFEGLVKIV